MENAELWAKYRKRRTVANRNAIVEYYLDLARARADSLSRYSVPQVTRDDILSAAYMGLMQAVETYDSEGRASFATHAWQRISGAVKDWMRAVDHHKRSTRTFERRRDAAIESATRRNGRPACDADIETELGLTAEEYGERTLRLRNGAMHNVLDVSIAASGARPDSTVRRQLFIEYISRGLSDAERNVLTMYYFEGMTLAEIGLVMALSESRISQVRAMALSQLRARFPSCGDVCAA
jgi:RNA polymerase sigma factor for flagellar operon FliA